MVRCSLLAAPAPRRLSSLRVALPSLALLPLLVLPRATLSRLPPLLAHPLSTLSFVLASLPCYLPLLRPLTLLPSPTPSDIASSTGPLASALASFVPASPPSWISTVESTSAPPPPSPSRLLPLAEPAKLTSPTCPVPPLLPPSSEATLGLCSTLLFAVPPSLSGLTSLGGEGYGDAALATATEAVRSFSLA